MKAKLIFSYIALTAITIIGTPILMIIGVIDGWKCLIEELKTWHRKYWRANDERN